jgi:hypothetical protein
MAVLALLVAAPALTRSLLRVGMVARAEQPHLVVVE